MEIEQSRNLSPAAGKNSLPNQPDASFFTSASVQKRIQRRVLLDWLARKVFSYH